MSYVQLFASSENWLVSEERIVYRDDKDELIPGSVTEIIREFRDMAEFDGVAVEVHSICHHHVNDGRECNCVQYHAQTRALTLNPERKRRHV